VEPQAAPADVSGTLRSFVAEAIADRLVEAGGELPEERRLITALFADVSGFTALADRLDPEQLLEVIDPVIAGLSSIVGRYDGYVEKFAGDALLALFGAPVSHEDDAERALRVALEMHRELETLRKALPYDADLTLHVGVNSGHGIARILGSEARMDYGVLGDSVILAQRLESVAPKGETYVSDLTYRLTSASFDFESVGELTLKGKTEPVRAWRLVRERTQPRLRVVEGRRALVGRERELAAADAALAGLRDGAGAVVAIIGEPGVGKSRLTEEVRARAEATGCRWLDTRCLSYGGALPYWPYAELLRSVAGITMDESAADAATRVAEAVSDPDAAAFVARLLGLPTTPYVETLEPEGFRRGLHDSIIGWISALASAAPVVLAIEDVHWLDASSAELTAELARVGREAPLALYLVGRPEAAAQIAEVAGETTLHELELLPLDAAAIAELTTHILGAPPPPELPALVRDRAGGNPLFVEELVRSLQETESLVRRNGSWAMAHGWDETAVPPTIEELLAARIDLLSRDASALLATASVIGRRIRVPLLEAVVAEDVGDRLAALVGAGFLDRLDVGGEEWLTFHHALVQDVAYGRLLRRKRREVHRRVAEVAEAVYGAGDDTIDLLARHLYLAEVGATALPYLLRAGDRSRRLFANAEAIVHYSRAAEVARADDEAARELPEILLTLADLHDLVGDYDQALALYSEVREATPDVRAWRGLVAIHRKRGEYAQALAIVNKAFQNEDLADADMAPLWLENGWTLSVAGRFGQAVEVLQAGLAGAGDRRDAIVGQLLLQLVRAESMEGRYDDALEHALAAQTIFEALGDQRGMAGALRIIGSAYAQVGQLERATEAFQRGLELAERVGSVEEIGGCLINLGVIQLERGEYGDAIDSNRRAIAEFERIGHGSGRATAYGNLADSLARAERYNEALDFCDRAIEVARSIGRPSTVADATRTFARIRLHQGDYAEAGERAEEAAALFLDMNATPAARESLELAAEAWEQNGNAERAQDVVARARSLELSLS
jgi:class 3 adenylate cyclase/tetratricopeptide (TPR) repeat protein